MPQAADAMRLPEPAVIWLAFSKAASKKVVGIEYVDRKGGAVLEHQSVSSQKLRGAKQNEPKNEENPANDLALYIDVFTTPPCHCHGRLKAWRCSLPDAAGWAFSCQQARALGFYTKRHVVKHGDYPT